MEELSLEKVFDLLGTRRIPGDPKQLRALRLRLAELAELNGEPWIRENRRRLLDQWKKAVNLNDKGHHP